MTNDLVNITRLVKEAITNAIDNDFGDELAAMNDGQLAYDLWLCDAEIESWVEAQDNKDNAFKILRSIVKEVRLSL